MIYPMATLVFLTFAVALVMFKERVRALRHKEVSIRYFKNYDTPVRELPPRMVTTQRCFNNLLEIPPLFYCACLTALIVPVSGVLITALAWLYVLCRLAQAIIHLGHNNVIWRMRAFLLSNIALLAMWFYLVAAYAAS